MLHFVLFLALVEVVVVSEEVVALVVIAFVLAVVFLLMVELVYLLEFYLFEAVGLIVGKVAEVEIVEEVVEVEVD